MSSLPLLSTFLKSYARPYLGIQAPAATKQISASSEPGTLSEATTTEANESANGSFPELFKEEDELVERDVRDRFKKMCEGYFDSVCKKLVIEHNVSFRVVASHDAHIDNSRSACKSRIDGTMRRISGRERYSKIDSKHMRK